MKQIGNITIKKQHIIIFIATMVWGLAAHGYMFFNKFSWHDDMNSLFRVGSTYTSGRWFLGVLGECVQKCFGNVSVPWFNGLFSLLVLAAANVVLVELFRMKRSSSCILLGGLMVTFPSWVATYAYMFTASYYAVAVFLAVLGIYIVWEDKKTWRGIIVGAICISLSLGIYQAYLPVAVTVLLIAFINSVIMDSERSFVEHFRTGFFGVLAILLGLFLYFVINNIALAVNHTSLSDYQSINQMGHTNLKMIANGIVFAWKDFIMPIHGEKIIDKYYVENMYMSSVRIAYYATLVLTAVLLIRHMIQCWKKNRATLFYLLGAALCFPVGVNSLYLMGELSYGHALMLYAKVMVFVFPLVLVERMNLDMSIIKKYGTSCLSILLIYVSVFYTHFANVSYLQADYQQKELISWMNVLVARIQSQKGYSENLPIAWLNVAGASSTTTRMDIPGVGENLASYQSNFSNWKIALLHWCGFEQEELTDTSGIESMQEVQDMPSYPEDGSVRIIDGVIIVKFPETQI